MASTQNSPDYYHILQVSRDADLKEIKINYRRLALIRHPDKNPAKNAKAEFQLLQEAYSNLSEPQLRQAYDATYRAYTFTSSNQHSTRQSDSKETSDKDEHKSPIQELVRKLAVHRANLKEQEKCQQAAQAILTKLNSDMAVLDIEIRTMEQDKAAGQTMWGYLDTFLPGGGNRQERYKEEQDRLYRGKMAARRIKETKKRRRTVEISDRAAVISTLRQQILSIEQDIKWKKSREQEELARKRAEQMRREQQAEAEIARKRAEQMRREQRAQEELARKMAEEYADQMAQEQRTRAQRTRAQRTQAKHRAQRFPNPNICKHMAWWTQVEGSFRCCCCERNTRRFAFQCPGCEKIACAPCRDDLRLAGRR